MRNAAAAEARADRAVEDTLTRLRHPNDPPDTFVDTVRAGRVEWDACGAPHTVSE